MAWHGMTAAHELVQVTSQNHSGYTYIEDTETIIYTIITYTIIMSSEYTGLTRST